mmetsp:Transcript_14603/g.29260  ORF Transcript_14603/g.29260 Transcript_14603/m.29260 type:complete len:235 (+) Transcript_14603:300-1004(+)
MVCHLTRKALPHAVLPLSSPVHNELSSPPPSPVLDAMRAYPWNARLSLTEKKRITASSCSNASLSFCSLRCCVAQRDFCIEIFKSRAQKDFMIKKRVRPGSFRDGQPFLAASPAPSPPARPLPSPPTAGSMVPSTLPAPVLLAPWVLASGVSAGAGGSRGVSVGVPSPPLPPASASMCMRAYARGHVQWPACVMHVRMRCIAEGDACAHVRIRSCLHVAPCKGRGLLGPRAVVR